MAFTVDLVTSDDQLSSADIESWNALAANPMQRWEWLGSWWQAYGAGHDLYVLRVRRDDELIALAPWFLENRATTGRTIRFLGSGKACSDHLSLLVAPHDVEPACETLANWLVEAGRAAGPGWPRHMVWDAIEWIGVDRDDRPINCLTNGLKNLGLSVRQSEGLGCYVIGLPAAWDDYVQLRSKSGRREIRQSLKLIDDGTIAVRTVDSELELERAWDQFADLHQRRRHAAGTTGCFDHPPFGSFLRNAASRLLQANLLRLVIASADDVPVATQFALVDQEAWYFYQSGMAPEAASLRPGVGVFCHAIRETIRSGRKRFDMLRGDEAYKLRWRAELCPTQEVRACSPRAAARLRNQVYSAGIGVKNLIKTGMRIAQPE